MGECVLEIKNVSCGVLKDVSLELEKGAFCLVLGPSGSGKTTLLKAICRTESLISGQIVVNGQDISQIDNVAKWRVANIGYILEENNVIPTLTVLENTELPLVTTGVEQKTRQERVLQALEHVGLKDKQNLYPKKISTAEQQKVALARAFAAEPAIILADEPTGQLNRTETENMIELMAEMNKTGFTFIVASHDNSLERVTSKVLKL